MSQPASSTSSQQQRPAQPAPTDTRPPNAFAKFDDRIAAVCDRILPKQPYLITIPSKFPYRRHTADPNRWFLNTPFSRKEEQLQYMSLLLHQGDDESLLKVDGTRIDEDGRLLAPAPSPQSEVPSRSQTPIESGPKKKISLKDYQSKDRSGVNTPERRPADDIRKQAIKSHKEEIQAMREDQATLSKPAVKSDTKLASLKVSASALKSETRPSLALPTTHDKETQRPAKKRRLSVEAEKPTALATPRPLAKRESGVPDKRPLPVLLSPDIPTQEKDKKKRKSRDLPLLLSPKLPEVLEKAAKSPLHRSDEVKAILKSAVGTPVRSSEKRPIEAPNRDVVGRIRSESQTTVVPTPPDIKISSPISKATTTIIRPGTPLTNGRIASPKPRQRHIIVLKYGKKNKKRVERLLNLAPRLKKEISTLKDRPPSLPTKSTERPEASSLDKKRPLEPNPDTSSKKAKLAVTSIPEQSVKLDRPSTPKLATAEKHKAAFSTPKKEARSAMLSRVPSTDGLDASTPIQEPHRISTPIPLLPPTLTKTSPSATSLPAKTEESWSSINEKIFALGRILKREGSKLAVEGNNKERQQGVMLLIEGLLCFMINSAALAQARPNADPQWSTILPYLNMVYKQSRPYKHLSGLVLQLGAVCRQSLQQEQLRRLSKETLPDDHIGSAPTPGSDGNTRSLDENTRRQKFIELRDELVQNSKALRIAWLDGCKILSTDTIERDYPSTWRKRLTDTSKRNPDDLNPKHLPKDFALPLDMTTNAFEATNFALAFLREWTMIEQVSWKSRIEL